MWWWWGVGMSFLLGTQEYCLPVIYLVEQGTKRKVQVNLFLPGQPMKAQYWISFPFVTTMVSRVVVLLLYNRIVVAAIY